MPLVTNQLRPLSQMELAQSKFIISHYATCSESTHLNDDEIEELRKELGKFDDNTKISPEEINRKRDLVDWLLKLLFDDPNLKRVTRKPLFKAGSAYEKVQAGEATDFDAMAFLDISKGIWRVENDTRPGFSTITLVKIREAPKKNGEKEDPKEFKKYKKKHFVNQLLDDKHRLSALKVRKLFTSKIDKVLKKRSPLEFKDKEKTVQVKVLRKQRGPATTLALSCEELKVPPFTLDIVNSIHDNQVSSKRKKQHCDFVAKPIDKQNAFTSTHEHLWRRSYSRKESKKFKGIDAGNTVRKRVLRIFKILRANQSQLKCLKSYIYKNVLLFLSDVPQLKWEEAYLPERFMDMVIALRDCLAARNLPAFFNPSINLLEEYGKTQLLKISGYLRRIAKNGLKGYKDLLSLKERKEMERIALAQKHRKKRKRKAKARKSKSKLPVKPLLSLVVNGMEGHLQPLAASCSKANKLENKLSAKVKPQPKLQPKTGSDEDFNNAGGVFMNDSDSDSLPIYDSFEESNDDYSDNEYDDLLEAFDGYFFENYDHSDGDDYNDGGGDYSENDDEW